jgi:hypothetical protein
MSSSVMAQIDLMNEETPQCVDHCEDDHGKELEKGEDVGFVPHIYSETCLCAHRCFMVDFVCFVVRETSSVYIYVFCSSCCAFLLHVTYEAMSLQVLHCKFGWPCAYLNVAAEQQPMSSVIDD